MTKMIVKSVRDYLTCGLAAVLASYGKDDYDHVMNEVLLPGFTTVICTSTGEGRISEMAGEYRALFHSHPEAMQGLVAMAVSLGVGFAALEEVR